MTALGKKTQNPYQQLRLFLLTVVVLGMCHSGRDNDINE